MNLKTFSLVWAVLYAGFGLGLLLIPALFMGQYGVILDENGIFMTRILGSALTAFAFTFYMNRNIPIQVNAQRSLLLGSCIYNIIDTPIVSMATLNGTMNALGWLPVILHVFLAVSMGYFAFMNSEKVK